MIDKMRLAMISMLCMSLSASVIEGAVLLDSNGSSDTPSATSKLCTTAYNCWNGAGWYEEDEGGLYAGPFASRVECEHVLLAEGHSFEDYDCFEYSVQPQFDKR